MRKELGLLSLLFAAVHMVLSIALMSPTYFKPWFLPADSTAVRMNWLGETVLLLGVLSIFVMVVLAITSVPGVGDSMSWREWRCLHTYVAYVGLIMAASHVTVIAVSDWLAEPWYMAIQRLTFLSSVFVAWPVVLVKTLLLLPPIGNYLHKIRCGWEREYDMGDEHAEYKKE